MTLIISAKGQHAEKDGKDDFIVVGCDSRGVVEVENIIRTEINTSKKLFQLGDYCCIMLSGDEELGITLIKGFLEKTSVRGKGVSKIAQEFYQFAKKQCEEIDDFTLVTQKLFPDVDFIISGMDKQGKKFTKGKIFILRKSSLFFPLLIENFIPSGQSLLAFYLFEKYYKSYKKSKTLDDMCFLVGQSIYDTQRINGNVGGDITVAVIDSKKFRILNAQDFFKDWDNQELDQIIHGPSK